jgi:hypothetical protein
MNHLIFKIKFLLTRVYALIINIVICQENFNLIQTKYFILNKYELIICLYFYFLYIIK